MVGTTTWATTPSQGQHHYLGDEPLDLQHGLGLGLPPAELDEQIQWVGPTALRQHGVPVLPPQRHHRPCVVARVLERGESVGGEDLGPLVAVVPRGVSALEDVAEGAHLAGAVHGGHGVEGLVQMVLELQQRLGLLPRPGVQLQIQVPQIQLVQQPRGVPRVPCPLPLRREVRRDGPPGAEVAQDLPLGPRVVEGEVLQELGGELDSIPLHIVTPGSHALGLRGQEVLEGVAELVEEGFDLLISHEHRVLRRWSPLVHDNTTQRLGLHARGVGPEGAEPGPRRLLPVAGPQIQVEIGDDRTVAGDGESADPSVPGAHAGVRELHHLHVKQALREVEEPGEDVVQGEVLAQGAVIHRVLLGHEPGGEDVHIPALQGVVEPQLARKSRQLHVLRVRPGLHHVLDLPQQPVHLRGLGHLRGEGLRGVVPEPQDLGVLLAQLVDAPGHREVVVLAPETAGQQRLQHDLPQLPAPGLGHHRREVPVAAGQHPRALVPRRVPPPHPVEPVRRPLGHHHRQPHDHGPVLHHQPPVVGGVQHVGVELGPEVGHLVTDVVEGGLLLPGEADAAELELLDLGIHDPLLGPGQVTSPRPQLLESPVQPLRLAEPLVELGNHRIRLVDGLAQGRGIRDALEVLRHHPRAAHGLCEALEGDDKLAPLRGGVGFEDLQLHVSSLHHKINRRDDVLRLHIRPLGQAGVGVAQKSRHGARVCLLDQGVPNQTCRCRRTVNRPRRAGRFPASQQLAHCHGRQRQQDLHAVIRGLVRTTKWGLCGLGGSEKPVLEALRPGLRGCPGQPSRCT
mmetsp:Transcript_9111/g.21826  ORF Transcript_9111/g.21826 Transcript_9111/m.21826 type:complete len:794 (-) Transcript_9111:2-2383(-)